MGEDVKETTENKVINDVVETTADIINEAVVEGHSGVEKEASVEVVAEVAHEVSVNTELEESVEPRTTVWRHDEESPYSPLYVQDKKQSKNNKITIALVIILVFCLVAGMIFAVSKLVEAAVSEVSVELPTWKESFANWKSDVEDYFAIEEEADEWEAEYEDLYEDEYEQYVPSPSDEYYVELADSICDNLSYTVNKEEYSYIDDDEAVGIYVEYVTVKGLDFDNKINDVLKEGAMYYAKEFGAGNVSDLSLAVVSYVTYMDEDILSVVVDERYTWGDEIQLDLYCMNFDLKTGTLLYNTDIIDIVFVYHHFNVHGLVPQGKRGGINTGYIGRITGVISRRKHHDKKNDEQYTKKHKETGIDKFF